MSKFLIKNEYKAPFTVQIMEDKEKFTIFIIGIILFLLLAIFLVPVSPLSISKMSYTIAKSQLAEQHKEELQSLISSYNNNGVNLSEDDYTFDVATDENGDEYLKIVVNEEKKSQMQQVNQETLNNIYKSKFVAYKPPTVKNNTTSHSNINNNSEGDTIDVPDEDQNQDESEDNVIEVPGVDELIVLLNNKLNDIDIYIQKALDRKDNYGNYTLDLGNYMKLLLDSRQIGTPAPDDIFPLTVSDHQQTYQEVNLYLNGQSFFENTYPELNNVDVGFKLLNTNFTSESCYKNLLDQQIYKLQFDEGDNFTIEAANDEKYIVYYKDTPIEYTALFKMSIRDYTIIFSQLSDQPIILDIIKDGEQNDELV